MLKVVARVVDQPKPSFKERYIIRIKIYSNEYSEVTVYDKHLGRDIVTSVNKKTLVMNRNEMQVKYGQLNVKFIENKVEEELLIKDKPLKLTAKEQINVTDFSIFVKEINRLLKQYNYTVVPEFKRVNGNLNVNLFESSDDKEKPFNRIEKNGLWYIHYFDNEMVKKAKDLEVIFK